MVVTAAKEPPLGVHSVQVHREQANIPYLRWPVSVKSLLRAKAHHFKTRPLQKRVTSKHVHFKNASLQNTFTSNLRHFKNASIQNTSTSKTRHFKTRSLQTYATSNLRRFKIAPLQTCAASKSWGCHFLGFHGRLSLRAYRFDPPRLLTCTYLPGKCTRFAAKTHQCTSILLGRGSAPSTACSFRCQVLSQGPLDRRLLASLQSTL